MALRCSRLLAHYSCLRMNGDQKLDAFMQEKQNFLQRFPEIIKVLTEDLGHPEIGDVMARLKQVLEYNVIGGKYQRGLLVLVTLRELVEPKKQDAASVHRALIVGWCVELVRAEPMGCRISCIRFTWAWFLKTAEMLSLLQDAV